MKARSLIVALVATILATSAVAQQQGTPQRIRGTIDAIDGNTLTMTSRGGEKFSLAMSDETNVSGTAPRSLADIGPGTFLASAGEKGEDGRIHAVEVRIFPEPRDARQFEWDLGPNSVMTNAPVAEVVAVEDGQLIKVSLPDGVMEYVIGADVPIYVMEPADRSLLVPGAYIVANTTLMPDGTYVVRSINAERNGLKPAL